MDQGAIIVGKTRLGAFAVSEVPPEKCIDYFPPCNPRGDGYQGPSGSSSGAGSTVASYDWVDITVGTDSKETFHTIYLKNTTADSISKLAATGSIRMLAASYGLWGLRSTWSSFRMDGTGIVPSVPYAHRPSQAPRFPFTHEIKQAFRHCGLACTVYRTHPQSCGDMR